MSEFYRVMRNEGAAGEPGKPALTTSPALGIQAGDRRRTFAGRYRPQLTIVLYLALGVACLAGPVPLVTDATSEYRILIRRDAPEPERFAALELSRYLFEISGARLPIEERSQEPRPEDRFILIGSAVMPQVLRKLDGATEDAFIIRTEGDHLILAGASPRATLYAVYSFLETLGVGFPRPGHGHLQQVVEAPLPQEETIPHRASISLSPIDRLEKPVFRYRALLTFPMVRERALREIDWMAKNRFNWIHLITNTDLSVWQRERVREDLIPEIRKRGLHIQGIGHSFYAYIPPERYFAEHPEYFGLIEGRRRSEHPRGAALCVSNEEVVALMAQNMSEFLDANPEIDVIDLWNNDGLGWCECDNCRRWQGLEPGDRRAYTSTTRAYLTFVNQVAARLAGRRTDIRVNALAYGFNLHSDPQVKPGPNVLIGIAPWSRVSYAESDDYYVPIAQPGPVNDYLRIAIPGWAAQTKELYIYDYYASRHEFFPIIDTLRKDYAWYRQLGIDMVSSETYFWDEFNLWAYGRLAWQPTLPLKGIIDEYCRIAYRAAGEPMKRFHLLLERHKWEWPAHRDELEPLLRQAREQAAAAGDTTVQAKLGRLSEILARDPQKSWPHRESPPELGE